MPQLILDTLNLEAAERHLCTQALDQAGNIVGAAKLLGITRHAMKRRIVKLGLPRTRPVHAPIAAPSLSPNA